MMTISRLPDWRSRLTLYLTAIQRRPFAMGDHDCALFIAGAVAAMIGTDLAKEYRGKYKTVKQGFKVLKKAGFADHFQLVETFFEPVPPAFANVGDIAVIDLSYDPPALGIFEGQHILAINDRGLAYLPREAATAAYRVP